MQRIWTIFRFRILEFVRDRGALLWNFLLPLILVVVFAFSFQDKTNVFTAGYIGKPNLLEQQAGSLRKIPAIHWQSFDDNAQMLLKLKQHTIDIAINLEQKTYWINPQSPKSETLDMFFKPDILQRQILEGKPLRYVDWVLPGIIAANLMYGSLYGICLPIVRYRKKGYLKRLQATPLSVSEFLTAHILSRFLISQIIIVFIFFCSIILLNLKEIGNLWLALLVSCIGSLTFISLGTLLCSRTTSEEWLVGIIEIVSLPMFLFSQVWFSLDNASPWLQHLSNFLPLTYLIRAWREILYYEGTWHSVQADVFILIGFTTVFFLVGIGLFKWQQLK